MKLDLNDAAAILGIPTNAAEDDIKRAYRQLSKQTHPDKNGTAALFNIVRESYELMMAGRSHHTAQTKPWQDSRQTSNSNAYPWTDAIIPIDILYHVYLNQTAVKLKHNGQTVILTPQDLGQFPEDFILSFDNLWKAADADTLVIEYHKFKVSITQSQAAAFSIKSYLPMEVTVSSWPTWLHKLFHRKPKDVRTKNLDYKNNAYNKIGNQQSLEFLSRMSADLDKGYHEITLKFLNQTITVHALLLFRNKSVIKKVRYYTATDHPILIAADIVFHCC